MRKGAAILAATGLLAMGVAAPAQAQEALPEHGHLFVIGVEYEGGEPVGFRKCIELASGRALSLGAHHEHAHRGRAGQALLQAGHMVVPKAPLSPFESCADLEALLAH